MTFAIFIFSFLALFLGLLFALPSGSGFSSDVHTAFYELGKTLGRVNFILPVSEWITTTGWSIGAFTAGLIFKIVRFIINAVRGGVSS